MNDFPLTREQWYAQRDDRTRRVGGVAGFDGYSVGVIVDERVSSSYETQVMTITALNILSRWCRRIKVQIPVDSVSCLPLTKGRNLQSLLEEIVKSSDPFNDFSFGDIGELDVNQLLIIGPPKKGLRNPQLLIAGAGWLSGIAVGTEPLEMPSCSEPNPIGPSFSACLGVAELFRAACGFATRHGYIRWYSLLDFTSAEHVPQIRDPHPFPALMDLGRVYQIGCGAIGSGLDFFLSLMTWRGVINLIDYDFVAVDNCNRSLGFSAKDAVGAAKKTHVCSRVLAGSSIVTDPFEGDYSDFIARRNYLKIPPDLILCLANERNIWDVVQQNLPPVVLHATTSSNWGLNLGRHIPKKEWCILCRFSTESLPRFAPVCAEGVLPSREKGSQPILGVLPFLSPAAAVLILSELAKMHSNDYPSNENFVQLSMKSANSTFLTMHRDPTENCLCKQQRLTYYPDEIKSTKFWHLTGLPGSH